MANLHIETMKLEDPKFRCVYSIIQTYLNKLLTTYGNEQQVACFFSLKNWNKNQMCTFGESDERYVYKHIPISTHAEIAALNRIENIKPSKKYDLLVLRISKVGNLSLAKPCYHCIKQLERAPFIKISNVFYSDRCGIIQVTKFNNLTELVRIGKYTYISSGYRHRMKLSK